MSLFRTRIRLPHSFSLIDLLLLLGFVLFIYAIIGVAHEWVGPYRPKTEIDLSFLSLLHYSFLSLVRVFLAYGLSLIFTLTYGYWAAKSKRAEPFLIPLLDILQSVPVLGFMPGLVLALVSVFPKSNLGLELAAIVMIFTGQGWNMVFSFYSSLKSIPGEYRDLASLLRMRKFDVLRTIELPYATNGLLWNSMLSMAGGWFFLMVIESFTLGTRDFRLAGIGSYMAVAYEQRDTTAVFLGIAMMFTLIILVDRCLWAPLVVWSERFRFERPVRSAPRSLVLDWLKRSRLLESFIESGEELRSWTLEKLLVLQNKAKPSALSANSSVLWKGVKAFFILLGAVGLLFGIRGAYRILSVTHGYLWLESIQLTAFTFIRVTLAVVLGSLWTIPVGVFIGTQPKWTTRLQPVVQVVASFPAPMLFPALVFVMSKLHLSIEFGSVILMIFASQWYILFNVISGATLIPRQMMDLSAMFQVRGWTYWRSIILPAIFPSLVNGWITAAGGAWNASIVSELVQGPQGVLIATGVGSSITRAAEAGDFANLACGVVTMVTTVVLLNRFLWGYLYKLAETKFRMDY